MKIKYIEGNLFDTKIKNIVHGCNAQGVMGSGVARIIRDDYPEAYNAYIKRHKTRGLEVGQIQWVETNGKMICNAITQEFYGRDKNTIYVSYDGLRDAMSKINNSLMLESADSKVAMPKIGAGLANGDWEIISKIIEEESTFFEPVVYVI